MRYLNNKGGSIQILVVMALTALLGAAALSVDVGLAMSRQIQLSNSLDAAALAGGKELPANPSLAVSVARQYLTVNHVDPDNVTITVSNGNRKLTLIGAEPVQNHFAATLGIPITTVHANAAIMVGPLVSATGGLRPLAVEEQPLIYGQSVTLKEGGGDGSYGNYGAVSFGGNYGAAVFRNYLYYGYDGVIRVGDWIDTEPGNMASSISTVKDVIALDPAATFSSFSANSPRVWTIPIVQSMVVQGRDEVLVVGFAQFFIEDIEKKSGQAEIVGRFVQFVSSGEIGQNQQDFGAYGVKLIE